MKVFLSHKMNGVPVGDVMRLRARMKSFVESVYGPVEIIDNYSHPDAPENAGRLWHLGRSIQMMADADLVVFCYGHDDAKGCRVERLVCTEYDIPSIYMADTNLDIDAQLT